MKQPVLEDILPIVRSAGQIILRREGADAIRAKAAQDFVTEVDFRVQNYIRDALADIIKTQNSHQNVGVNVGVNVGTNEEKVLALLRQDGRLTAKVLASTLGLTERQVERIVASLKKRSVLIRHGASKNGFWEVVDKI